MRSLLKRPMFRRGGPIKEEGLSTMRANFNNGTQPLMPLPKPQNRGLAGFDEKFSMNEKSIRDAMGSPKDTRFLRYLSRAAGNLGNQRGGTALQRISRAMAGDPMEKLFNETDQFRGRNQGIKNAALQRTLGQLDRDEKRTYDEEQLAKLQAYEASQNSGKDNRTAEIKNLEYTMNQFKELGKPIYTEDGDYTKDFETKHEFLKIARAIQEKIDKEYSLVNYSGSKRDLEAQKSFNAIQEMRQFHGDKATEAGLKFATVEEYVQGNPLKPYVLYTLMDVDDQFMYGDTAIDDVAYIFRDGDDVKLLDFNFEEISVDNENEPLNDPFEE
jgi:hypothetical protein